VVSVGVCQKLIFLQPTDTNADLSKDIAIINSILYNTH